jgi:hypothetical protein
VLSRSHLSVVTPLQSLLRRHVPLYIAEHGESLRRAPKVLEDVVIVCSGAFLRWHEGYEMITQLAALYKQGQIRRPAKRSFIDLYRRGQRAAAGSLPSAQKLCSLSWGKRTMASVRLHLLLSFLQARRANRWSSQLSPSCLSLQLAEVHVHTPLLGKRSFPGLDTSPQRRNFALSPGGSGLWPV